jgi:hypothetical protein
MGLETWNALQVQVLAVLENHWMPIWLSHLRLPWHTVRECNERYATAYALVGSNYNLLAGRIPVAGDVVPSRR